MTKTISGNSEGTRSAHLEWVPLEDMHVNPRAQREFRENWAKQILADFDIDKFTVPTVSHRDGNFYIIDGQHGTWAYREWLGDYTGQKIQCWVHRGLTEEQEAELFLSLNNRKTVNAFDRFTSAVTAGRIAESDVDRIVRAQGCLITKQKVPHSIRAVSSLIKVYNGQGAWALAGSVRVIRDAYGDEGYEAQIVEGLGMVLARYRNDIDIDRLVDRLYKSTNGSKGLIQKAKVISLSTGARRSEATAAAVVDIYNVGRGGKKLPSWWREED